MPPNNKRRAVVQRLIAERFGGRVVDFARSINRSPAQVWQFMNDRNIGERLARHIEVELNLPPRELEGEDRAPAGLSADEMELLRNYRRSLGSWQDMLRQIAGVRPHRQHEALSKALSALSASLATPDSAAQVRRDSERKQLSLLPLMSDATQRESKQRVSLRPLIKGGLKYKSKK